jgi:hypothetical protein
MGEYALRTSSPTSSHGSPDHPLNDPFTGRACRAAVRSAEAMVADFAAHDR